MSPRADLHARSDGFGVEKDGFGRDDLTASELAVLQALADGLALKEIATLRTVTLETVRTQAKHARRKLDVYTTCGAVAAALRLELIG